MIKEGDLIIGTMVRAKVVKNKIAPPFREAEFELLFDCGISREGDLIELAGNSGVIARSGSWLSYKETRLGQGRDNARQFLRDNQDIYEAIRKETLAVKLPKRPEEAQGKKPADPASGNGSPARAANKKSAAAVATAGAGKKRG